jgi:hypothetical protein
MDDGDQQETQVLMTQQSEKSMISASSVPRRTKNTLNKI